MYHELDVDFRSYSEAVKKKDLGRVRRACTERTVAKIHTEAWVEGDDDYGD